MMKDFRVNRWNDCSVTDWTGKAGLHSTVVEIVLTVIFLGDSFILANTPNEAPDFYGRANLTTVAHRIGIME